MTEHDRSDVMLAKSYNYVRVAMVAVLLLLGLAVFRQIWTQDWAILSSISAYYYTPAQAVFVAALVALGVCMVALQGTNRTEDVLLNLGGMLAPVVALVPTSRGADHEEAVAECEAAGGYVAGVDCPSVRTLEEIAGANIGNNVWALLVVGAVALVAAVALTGRAVTGGRRPGSGPRQRGWSPVYAVGYAVACVLYLLALITFVAFRDTFVDRAHWVAAVGLFLCILAVAVTNAVRRATERSDDRATPITDPQRALVQRTLTALRVGLTPRDLYSSIAAVMLLAGLVLGVLAAVGALLVFWLEAALVFLFAVFWVAQTAERWNHGRAADPAEPAPPGPTSPAHAPGDDATRPEVLAGQAGDRAPLAGGR